MNSKIINIGLVCMSVLFLSSTAAEARKRHHHGRHHHHIHTHKSVRSSVRTVHSMDSNIVNAKAEQDFLEEKEQIPFLEVNWSEVHKDNQMSYDELPTPIYVEEVNKIVVDNKPIPRKQIIGSILFVAFLLTSSVVTLLPRKRK